ncbi:MAG: hypothetical protein AAF725_15710, partial [Acidobacteriota bacterium]
MAKKTRSEPKAAPRDSKDGGGKPRAKNLWVVAENGQRQRFLRGAITYHLTQRGLDFDDAYALARALRDQLSEREEITTSELRDLVDQRVEQLFGPEAFAKLTQAEVGQPRLEVGTSADRQPFSRGLLARSLVSASLDFDRAYRLAVELEGELLQDQAHRLSRGELALRVAELLERREGKGTARRYRVARRLQRLPKPLVLYVGGASGTGKSTLALELAPLLKIYRVTATDTVRQVMRSLISPQILPSIHSSSFTLETAQHWPASDPREEESEQRLVDGFFEQAVRLGVGVRAVVERAIAENTSTLVEGVHLVPPVIPFRDLEGACYQVPLMLGIQEIEEHRLRFLSRDVSRGRTRYVQSFENIRNLHDFLIHQAESEGLPFLDTSRPGTAPRALRLVAATLQEQVPSLGRADAEDRRPSLLLAFDGVADVPVRSLGDRTPLTVAETPTLDRLAREGLCGLADPLKPGVVPDTAAGTLALLGQSPSAMQRGPIEALGTEIDIRPGDIALRANFATLDESGHIIDRRAGRIRDEAPELARAIDDLSLGDEEMEGVRVRVAAATEHRLAVVLRGEGLSSHLRGSDPGEAALPTAPLEPEAAIESDREAAFTCRVLARFERRARRVLEKHEINRRRLRAGQLPANAVLTRGAGRLHRLPPLETAGLPIRLACVAGDRTVQGLASWLGARLHREGSLTANLDTDLERKFALAEEALASHDLVILHVKGA